MALAYQSTQTTSPGGGAGTSLAITKPTFLAVGDLIVAIINVWGSSPTVTTPTGWTLTGSQANSNIGIYVFMKTADAGDVAASNFTFSGAWGGDAGGSIMRFTGADPSPSDQINFGTISGSAYSGTGITPSRANSIMVIATNYFNSPGQRTVSGYAITTSNPTWMEVADVSATVGNSEGFAIAYGPRPQTTATGADSATLSGSSSFGGYIAIFDIMPAYTVYASPLTLALPSLAPVFVRLLLPSALTILSSLGAAAASGVANKWSNASKHIVNWLNQQKS